MPAVESVLEPTRVEQKEVDPSTLKQWLDAGTAVLVDVREPEEYAREHIAGARLVPLSRFDAASLPPGGTVVLHCRSGRRSAEGAGRAASGGRADVLQLKGGIEAWKAAGLPVEENRHVPISIMRQVQLVAGTCILATTLLGAFLSPYFLLLTGFFGAGLAFAGATGTCGMATFLGAMPWNKAFRAQAPTERVGNAGSCCGGKCKE